MTTQHNSPKKRGRPPKCDEPRRGISWKIPESLLAKIDAAALASGKDRTMMLEYITHDYFKRNPVPATRARE